MQTCISILRGINISGHRLIKMEALRAMYEELGFSDVQSYIQSGNVIFRYDSQKIKDPGRAISDQIFQKTGFEVPVILLETEELRQIIAANPFLGDPDKDVSKIYVTFLSEIPAQERYQQMITGQHFQESFELTGKAIFVYSPNGYGNTKLSTNFLESKLKVTATSRNWKTTMELLRLAENLGQEKVK